MKHIGIAAALFALAAFAAGRVSAGEDGKPAAKTVKALRYRPTLVDSPIEWSHGGGVECDELWFAEKRVVANVITELDGLESRLVMHAFPGEGRWKAQTPRPHDAPRDLPTEEVEVPAELAQRIFDLAELTDRQTKASRELAAKAVGGGVSRKPGVLAVAETPK